MGVASAHDDVHTRARAGFTGVFCVGVVGPQGKLCANNGTKLLAQTGVEKGDYSFKPAQIMCAPLITTPLTYLMISTSPICRDLYTRRIWEKKKNI